MTHTYVPPSHHELGLVTILSLHSLTRRQFNQVADVLSRQTEEWSIERQVNYDGYALFMVTRESDGTTYIISGRSDRIELAGLKGDALQTVGCFQGIEHAVDAMFEQTTGCFPD